MVNANNRNTHRLTMAKPSQQSSREKSGIDPIFAAGIATCGGCVEQVRGDLYWRLRLLLAEIEALMGECGVSRGR